MTALSLLRNKERPRMRHIRLAGIAASGHANFRVETLGPRHDLGGGQARG
jgi:hypothetical protein